MKKFWDLKYVIIGLVATIIGSLIMVFTWGDQAAANYFYVVGGATFTYWLAPFIWKEIKR